MQTESTIMTKIRHIILTILYKLFVSEKLTTLQLETNGKITTRSCIQLEVNVPFAVEWFKNRLLLNAIHSIVRGKNGNTRVVTEVDRFNSYMSDSTIVLAFKDMVTCINEKLMLGRWQESQLQLSEQTITASAQQQAT